MPGTVVGLVAGLLSALAYGSFAVPIKSKAVVDAKVHPLIFQSYKSLMCFLSAWVLLSWADFRFTWWATIAAAIWVTDGVMAIISIHLAGLGVAQTIWSCVSVFVSFAWGKLFFKEPIANVPLSFTGLALMVLGMVGLGWIASKFDTSSHSQQEPKVVAVAVVDEIFADSLEPDEVADFKSTRSRDHVRESESEQQRLVAAADSSNPQYVADTETGSANVAASEGWREHDALIVDPWGETTEETAKEASRLGRNPEEQPVFPPAHQPWPQRRNFALGVAGATLIGVLAGSMMVCLKLAPPDRQGDQYTVSFGIGVAGVTLLALGTFGGGCWLSGREPPSFQASVAAGPACLAGILWSIGNYLSIVAVDRLGMAVGWPLVQCSLIVSNTWALLWYREIQGSSAVLYFFCCSVVILLGVFLLACFGL